MDTIYSFRIQSTKVFQIFCAEFSWFHQSTGISIPSSNWSQNFCTASVFSTFCSTKFGCKFLDMELNVGGKKRWGILFVKFVKFFLHSSLFFQEIAKKHFLKIYSTFVFSHPPFQMRNLKKLFQFCLQMAASIILKFKTWIF